MGVGFFLHHAGPGAETQVIALGVKVLATEPSLWHWPALHFIKKKNTVLGLIFDNLTAPIPQAICFLVQGDDAVEFTIFTQACFLPQMLAYPAAVTLQMLLSHLGCVHPHAQAPT